MDASEVVDDILSHVGVKGMRWGVRRSSSNALSGNTRRRKEKLYKKATKAMEEKHLPRINAKHKDSSQDGTLLRARRLGKSGAYEKEVADAYISELNKALGGNKKYTISRDDFDYLGFTVNTVERKAQHEENDDSFRVLFVRDAQGAIIGFEFVDNSLTQSAIDEVLAHVGVKGMRWGVRRKATVDAREVIVRDTRKKIKTSGGKGLPAHRDAIPARIAGQKIKKSGVKALSDQELNAYAKRIQLEQNVRRLQYNEKSRGERWLDSFLGRQGNQLANEAASRGGSEVGRKALRLAAAAA